jgi:hypothetical protein
MDESYKLRVKVGVSEFEAEGPADVVKQQFSDFLAAVAAISATPAGAVLSGSAPILTISGTGTAAGTSIVNGVSAPDRNELRRIFSENDAVISLTALPQTETPDADAVLLLIYGYHELKKDDYPVTGVRLMQAAKQSGLHQVDRIDRTIATHDSLVLKAGLKRGRKYQLNNQGIAKAQELIKRMLG